MFDIEAQLERSRHEGAVSAEVERWAESDDEVVAAVANVVVACAAYERLELEQAQRLCSESIRRLETQPSPTDPRPTFADRGLWLALTILGLLLDDQFELDEAMHIHRRALKLAEDASYDRGVAASSVNLALQVLRAGDATEATYLILRELGADEAEAAFEFQGVWYGSLAGIYVGCGLTDLAIDHIERPLSIFGPDDRFDLQMSLGGSAFLHFAMGDHSVGMERLAELTARYDTARSNSAVRCLNSFIVAQTNLAGALRQLDELSTDKAYYDLGHPELVRCEILFQAGRWTDVVDAVDTIGDDIGSIAQTWVARRRVMALANLGRWPEAVVAGREAEAIRRGFDLDPERLIELSFAETDRGSTNDLDPMVTNPAGIGSPTSFESAHYGPFSSRSRAHMMLVHDIRTLFGAVQLSADLAEQAVDGRRYLDHLRLLKAATERVSSIPENVDAYRRLVAGHVKLRPARRAVAEIVNEVVDRCSLEASAKNIELIGVPSPECEIVVDEGLLAICLMNLMTNAIKFSFPGTGVTVGWRITSDVATTSSPTGGEDPGAPRLEITVTDSGPGLTPEDRRRLFLGGAGLSAHPTGGEPSTGLGLVIVQGAAQAMAAEIKADNNPAGGASFTIVLPAESVVQVADQHHLTAVRPGSAGNHDRYDNKPAVVAAAGPDHGSARSSARPQVLVVDDDQMTRSALSDILDFLGADCETASSYDDAFTVLTAGSTRFHLIMLDVTLEGAQEGFDLAKLATATHPSAFTTLMTGQTSVAAEHDGVPVLHKPLRLHDVRVLLARCQNHDHGAPGDAGALLDRSRSFGRVGRLDLLREVAKGRPLPESWIDLMLSSDEEDERLDALVIASINHEINGRRREALAMANQALATMHSYVDGVAPELQWHLHSNLGLLHAADGDHQTALFHHRRALAISDSGDVNHVNRATSIVRLADTLAGVGQHEEAVEVLVGGVDDVGSNPAAQALVFAGLGRRLLDQGAVTLAAAQFLEALANFPTSELDNRKVSLRHLAQAYHEMGDVESLAMVANRLDLVAAVAPFTPAEHAHLRSVRAAVTQALGRPKKALAMADDCLVELKRTGAVELAAIALSTAIDATMALGLHGEAVRRWSSPPDDEPEVVWTQRAHLAVADACERQGQFEAAFWHEQQAYQKRINRNRALPHLVALAHRMLTRHGNVFFNPGPALLDPLIGEPELADETSSLVHLLRDLRSAIQSEITFYDQTARTDFEPIADMVLKLRTIVMDLSVVGEHTFSS